MARPLHVRHADGTGGVLDLELVPFELATIDDAGSLRVAADWLFDRGHEHVPRYLVATADLWDAGCGMRLAELTEWFEEWRDGQPHVPARRVWCRYTGDDRWTRARLESLGRTRIRCRREPRGSRTTQTACVRAWWDIHRRTGNVRPAVELHQYDFRVNVAFAAALRRQANR